jgi:hypothetical protein
LRWVLLARVSRSASTTAVGVRPHTGICRQAGSSAAKASPRQLALRAARRAYRKVRSSTAWTRRTTPGVADDDHVVQRGEPHVSIRAVAAGSYAHVQLSANITICAPTPHSLHGVASRSGGDEHQLEVHERLPSHFVDRARIRRHTPAGPPGSVTATRNDGHVPRADEGRARAGWSHHHRFTRASLTSLLAVVAAEPAPRTRTMKRTYRATAARGSSLSTR